MPDAPITSTRKGNKDIKSKAVFFDFMVKQSPNKKGFKTIKKIKTHIKSEVFSI